MKIPLTLLIITICFCKVNAQSTSPQVVSSAGETYKGNIIQLDWTLGEVAITTIQNSSNQITQGFHQPNYNITSVDNLSQKIGEILVYPNPTSDKIEMKLNLHQSQNVKIQLIDINGRLIWSRKQIGSQLESVEDISHLTNGNYFLNFMINKHSHTFRIQKFN